MDLLRTGIGAQISNERLDPHIGSAAAYSDGSFHGRLLDSLYDGVYFVDAERSITYWNKGAERLTGYTAAEALGKHCYDNFLMHVNANGCALCFGGCPLAATLVDGNPREDEIFLRHKRGHRVPTSVRVSPVRGSWQITRPLGRHSTPSTAQSWDS